MISEAKSSQSPCRVQYSGGDAEAVARKHELTSPRIPERKGELPAQLLEHSLTRFLPQVRQDFRVAMRNETMPVFHESRALFGKVEELAVEDRKHVSGFVRDGLLSIRKADDAEPSRDQGHPRPQKDTFLVRTAMRERPRHRTNCVLRRLAPSCHIHDACDAAHNFALRKFAHATVAARTPEAFSNETRRRNRFPRRVEGIRRDLN